MRNGCPPIFPEIKTHEEQVRYIETIIKCERENTNNPLIEYLATGMSTYLDERVKE